MTRVIAVTGGKGGVGKTNISLNLALILSKLGYKVCLFDADLGLANINILLGLYPEYDLEDVISGTKSINEIMLKNYQGIDIIPGSSGVEKLANLGQDGIDHIIREFAPLDDYDFFIFDTSSGISKSVTSFCLAATDVVLVITPEPTSLTDAYALLKVLCFNGLSGSPKIVVNQCKNTAVASTAYNKLKEVVQKYLTLDIIPLGIIVRDNKIPEAVQRQQPLITLYPQSSAAKCINVIASRLLANEPENFKQSGIASFWTRFLEITKTPLTIPERAGNQKKTDTEGTPETVDSTARSMPQYNEAPLQLEDIPAPGAPFATPQNMPAPGAPEKTEAGGSAGAPPSPPRTVPGREDASLYTPIDLSIHLPTLPQILLKVIETCGREDAGMKDLSKIVEKDPSLCTKILRMVNSAHYSFSQKINSFNQALSLLGIDTIRNIAVSASVYQVFDSLKSDVKFNLKLFWWHSLMCAVLANLISKKIAYTKPDEAFLSGLLHDIGKLVLFKSYANTYTEMAKTTGPDTASLAREQHELGITHCEAGARLIRHWHLQSFIADAIRYHHEPVERIRHALPLVKIIFTANSLCSDTPGSQEVQYAVAEKIFGFTTEDVDELMQKAGEQVNQIAQSLDIAIQPPRGVDDILSDKDRDIQAYLTNQVRDISLLQGTLQNFVNARDVDSILHVAYQGVQIVFDLRNVLFFLYDESQNILIGKAPHVPMQHEGVNDLTISCQNGQSMLSMALKQGRVINSLTHDSDYELTIIDEQLIRLMGAHGILCFPMIVQKQYVGVVVFGLDTDGLARIHDRLKLLNMFINHLALALEAENTRQSQAKRVLAERLAASTAIARKVAHEVNNPLSIIKNYLKIFEIKLSEQSIPTDELKIINEEIDRVALIIDELSDFSRPKIQSLEPVYINSLLTDIVKLTGQSLAKSNIHMSLTTDAALPPIISDKNGLKQIFINIIKNAAEALRNGGAIAIATKYAQDSGSAEITIHDNGPGLPEAVQARLFEPYTSTKGEGHAGLGLSVVYSIIRELQGSITCTSEKGNGTNFTIVLPVVSETANMHRRQ